MTAMIIGGDHLGGIPDNLKENGYKQIKHLTGRKVKHVRKSFSENCDLILVLTDYVGTDLSRVIKNQAKEQGVPVVFARRSWSCIAREMNRIQCHGCRAKCKRPCSSTC